MKMLSPSHCSSHHNTEHVLLFGLCWFLTAAGERLFGLRSVNCFPVNKALKATSLFPTLAGVLTPSSWNRTSVSFNGAFIHKKKIIRKNNPKPMSIAIHTRHLPKLCTHASLY